MPIVEIARFASSEAYRKDPSIINPSLEILAAAKGVRAIFHGLQVEDQRTLHAVIIWDRVEDHKALINDEEAYAKLRTHLIECGSTEHRILHIPFIPDPLPRLRAPITELTFMTLKSGQSGTELSSLMDIVLEKSSSSLSVQHGTSWGKTIENDDLYILTMGWNSLEDHKENIHENETSKALTARLSELADFTLTHVHLTEHKF